MNAMLSTSICNAVSLDNTLESGLRALTPLSPSITNIPSSEHQVARKRKFEDFVGLCNIRGHITIQPPLSCPSENPLILVPKLLVPRSCIPFAFLSQNESSNSTLNSQLFQARVPALEEEFLKSQNFQGSTVLIAESDCTSNLYTIERVRCNTYALCLLGASVTLEDIKKLSLRLRVGTKLGCRINNQSSTTENLSGDAASIRTNNVSHDEEIKKWEPCYMEGFRLRVLLPKGKSQPVSPVTQNVPHIKAHEHEETTSKDVMERDSQQEVYQDEAEIFNKIRVQYQEMLYQSKGSLAYLVKGPLSRARAFFQKGNNSMASLSKFLRSCILSISMMDKKYREALPEVIRKLPVAVLSDDEKAPVIETIRKKNRKPKTWKIGRDGLVPGEEVNIAQWWIDSKALVEPLSSHSHEDESTMIRVHYQRARETQLQIILILEILTIEAFLKVDSDGMILHADEKDQDVSCGKQKSRKEIDLRTLLAVLIDRLCIWQSTVNDTGEGKISINETSFTVTGIASNLKPRFDGLREFCVEVVLPFYGSRLSEVSSMLCEKLGGLKPITPARPSLQKATSSSEVTQKSNAAFQAQPLRKPRRTLERVMTDEKATSRKRLPCLSRSATDSAIPGIKREISDNSICSVPLNKYFFQKSRRYSQREVDLSATSQASDARMRRKASVQQQLQSAIATLKKPNPRMAVKDLVDAADRRVTETNSRKTRNPLRNLSTRSVQVLATPSGNRHRDVFGGLQRLPNVPVEAMPELEEIPPSSGGQDRSWNTHKRKDSVNCQHTPSAIEQTPTRALSRPAKPLCNQESRTAEGSEVGRVRIPALGRTVSVEALVPTTTNVINMQPPATTTLPPSSNLERENQQELGQAIQQTPIKSVRSLYKRNERITSSPGVDEKTMSIYDSLGWNDDVDELL